MCTLTHMCDFISIIFNADPYHFSKTLVFIQIMFYLSLVNAIFHGEIL